MATVLAVLGAIFSLNICQGQVTPDEFEAAEAGQLKAVQPEDMPFYGTFFSWQQPRTAPSPVNLFPELTLYDLGDGRYLMDDRELDYSLVSELAGLMAESEGGGQAQMMMMEGVGEGCGLWLSISRNSSSNVLLTLHNTRQGQTYTVWRLTNLALTNWVVETNVTGASGDFTEALIAMGTRSNLFLKATEYRDYQVDTNSTFTGLGFSDTGQDPPDSMGAIGPNHFVELLNGRGTNSAIAVYTKAGVLVTKTNVLDFFRIGTNYPTGDLMADPRILYDQQAQRWVACAIDINGSKQVILAVSNGDSPTNLASGWTRHLMDLRRGSLQTDFTTLGLDDNGVYVSIVWKGTGIEGYAVMAIKKPEIYQGTLVTNRLDITNGVPVWTIQPAVNFDVVPTNGYAWFVAKGAPDLGTNYQGGAIHYRRLQWSGTNAAWADTDWIVITNSGPTYRDYYDLETTSVAAPQATAEGGIAISLGVGSRLAMPVIRNGFLWTCQGIGLGGTNGVYSGTNVDRTGAQWFRLGVDATGGTLSYNAHGRVYDKTSTTNAFYYYFPSLMVNCAGDMVCAFSGSSATNYIGAYYSWRLAGGTNLPEPRLIQPGLTNYTAFPRWGDYSATTLDPVDDWSFWTVQEYVEINTDPEVPGWRTVISRLRPFP